MSSSFHSLNYKNLARLSFRSSHQSYSNKQTKGPSPALHKQPFRSHYYPLRERRSSPTPGGSNERWRVYTQKQKEIWRLCSSFAWALEANFAVRKYHGPEFQTQLISGFRKIIGGVVSIHLYNCFSATLSWTIKQFTALESRLVMLPASLINKRVHHIIRWHSFQITLVSQHTSFSLPSAPPAWQD